MSTPRIVTHGGVTVDLESVKCFKVDGHIDHGKTNIMVIEFKATNVEYVFNPETNEHELHTFNDKIEVEYGTFESAEQHMSEWAEIWEDYLTKKKNDTTKP